MRLFNENTAWDEGRKSVRFTATKTGARKPHTALAGPLRDLLAQWNLVDQQRREAEDAVVDANAMVSSVDEELDECVSKLDNRLCYECGNDLEHPTYKAFFPEPPHEIIRLGLENEIARTRKFVIAAEERNASPEVWAILKEMAEIEKRGAEVLKGREEAYANVSRVALRIQTWREDANAARRSVETALEAWAIQNGKPRSYADAFFPAAPKGKKSKKKDAAPKPA